MKEISRNLVNYSPLKTEDMPHVSALTPEVRVRRNAPPREPEPVPPEHPSRGHKPGVDSGLPPESEARQRHDHEDEPDLSPAPIPHQPRLPDPSPNGHAQPPPGLRRPDAQYSSTRPWVNQEQIHFRTEQQLCHGAEGKSTSAED